MENNSRSQRVAKNTGIMFARMLLLMAIGLFTSREVLRILGVEDFGVYNLVGTIVVMFSFLQTALNNATTRFITFDLGTGKTDNLRKTFSMSINSEVLLAIIVLVLTEAVGPWFIEHKLNIPPERLTAAHIVFQFSLLNLLVNIIRTPFNSTIIAHERFGFFAYNSIIEAAAKLVIVYLLTVSSFDKLITYAILQVAVTVGIFLWMAIYCLHHFQETHYRWHWDGALLKKLTNYSGLSLLVNMVDVAVLQATSIFFNIFSGVVANAALGVAHQVNGQLNSFLGNFSQSYSPQIIKSYAAGDRAYFMKLIFSTSKLSFFLYLALAFPVMLNIDTLLNLWLDKVPEDTGLFLCLIIGHTIFDSFSQPLWNSVHATGNLKVHQLLMGGIKIMNIPISYILLKQGLPVFVVLVVFVSLNVACTTTRIWWLTHLIQLDAIAYCKEVLLKMVKITVIAIPVPIALHLYLHNAVVSLFATSFVFIAIYLAGIYRLALNEKELAMVRQMKDKIMKKRNKQS